MPRLSTTGHGVHSLAQSMLPFKLTQAQQRAVAEVLHDMAGPSGQYTPAAPIPARASSGSSSSVITTSAVEPAPAKAKRGRAKKVLEAAVVVEAAAATRTVEVQSLDDTAAHAAIDGGHKVMYRSATCVHTV